ncbi:MAG: saccharopine dehydrogenase NADP-binding domain-containing protein [Deltaproteobacteria bacterium]|nr:saccharopine dehydrogenase NADP-binding domain-containing protein [Deltaproteobacteria bacterium]
MMKICVLGGCGAVGSVAIQSLTETDVFDEIVIGDVNEERALEIAGACEPGVASVVEVDAEDPESIKRAIGGVDVVLNCVGPFYRHGPTILKATIEAGINYVDVCDDFDATEICLTMDEAAKKADVAALIGMGSSPGIANVLVRFCADHFLDECESIDIYHAHGGEEVEGPAVVKHRIHSMSVPIPVFIDGKAERLNMFMPEGRAFEETTEFADVGTYDVYLYPHPETITLPMYIPDVKRVTNLGLVLPPSYAELIKEIVRLGIIEEDPIMVQGHSIVPLEFAVAHILSQRARLSTYIFSMSSRGHGMGEGTGIPAALGSILMATGKIKGKGVLPPEACVDPLDLLALAKTHVKMDGKSGVPLKIEHIDADGKVEEIKI